MAKTRHKRPPVIYDWVRRGYVDGLEDTPFKRAPLPEVEMKALARDKWSSEVEQYFDGFNSAVKDKQEELIK